MKSYALTDKGAVRDTNQDYVYASEKNIGKLNNLFIVADGMGGHNAGDFASKYTVSEMIDYIVGAADTEPVKLLGKAIEKANEGLMREARNKPQYSGMGTTVVASTISEGTLFIANVGDSRLYKLSASDEKLKQITKDHSLVQEMVRMGEMQASEAKNHPDKNIITRAVGAFEELEIDFFEEGIEEGDVIIMCTDGLSNMVDDDTIREILVADIDVVDKVQNLISEANKNGGRDNISVIVIEC